MLRGLGLRARGLRVLRSVCEPGAMDGAIVRPGNGLLQWNGECIFHGDPVKLSGYMLGSKARVEVMVGDECDVLNVEFIAKGANRDVYKGRLERHPELCEFVVKAGSTLHNANASLAEMKILETGYEGGIAICFYVELVQEHDYKGHFVGEQVTLIVEPAVVTGQQYVRQLVAVADAHGGTREVILSVWAFFMEVIMFVWLLAPKFYMIDFRLENLYVYEGGVAQLDFEHAANTGTKLTRLGEALIQ